ncbi:MAG: hypothetical protein DRJ32_04975 [Thermoprotei archaeon]|nr:MAG: hypothetical protein DRJ32_04975 [Thermoprotei archaeon]
MRLKGFVKKSIVNVAIRSFPLSRKIIALISAISLQSSWVFTEAPFKFLLEIHVVSEGRHILSILEKIPEVLKSYVG